MKKHYKTIFFLIGVAGIVFLVIKANPDRLDWKELFTPELPLLFAGLLLLWAFIYAIHAEAYRLIAGGSASGIKRLEMYRICVTGFALNNVTPLGLAGGEPYRILELRNYMSTEKATSATITFSIMYIMGHVILWLTGILIYALLGFPGDTAVTVLLMVSAAALLAACIYFFGFRHKALVVPAFRFFSKLPFVGKKAVLCMDKNAKLFSDIDRCYAEFHENRKIFFTVIFMEYLSRLLEGAEYYLIYLYLGSNVHITGGILILSLASLIGNLLFIVPMQAGTREGGMAIALGILNISLGTGVMGGIIYRVRELACTAAGILLIFAGGKKGLPKE